MGTWSWNVNLPGPPPKAKYCVRCGSELLRKIPEKNDVYHQFHICLTKGCHRKRILAQIIYFLVIFFSLYAMYGRTFFVIAFIALFIDTFLFFSFILNMFFLPLYVYYMLHPRFNQPSHYPKLFKTK